MARVFDSYWGHRVIGPMLLRQAVESGHDVTVFVRDPSKLAPELSTRIGVRRGDLLQSAPDAIADRCGAMTRY